MSMTRDIATMQRAIDKVKRGWTQNNFRRFDKGKRLYCVVGAIDYSSKDPVQIIRLRDWVAMSLPEKSTGHPNWPISALTYFNDRRGRTKAEVLAVMTKALKAMRAAAKKAAS